MIIAFVNIIVLNSLVNRGIFNVRNKLDMRILLSGPNLVADIKLYVCAGFMKIFLNCIFQ